MNAVLRQRLSEAARAMLGSAVRHLLTILGAALVTRGLIDPAAVDGIVPMAAETIVGAILAVAASGWGQVRAYGAHTRWARAWAALTADAGPAAHDD